jgi:outer membrane protein assembly factor BamB
MKLLFPQSSSHFSPRFSPYLAAARPLLLAGLLGSVLSACGGGDGIFNALLVDTQNAFALPRNSVGCNAEPVLSCSDTLQATPLAKVADGAFSFKEIPDNGGTSAIANVARQKQADGTVLLTLQSRPGLAAGTYRGRLELNLFTLVPDPFSRVLPSAVSYTITVAADQGNTSALSKLTTEWEGFGGNAAHTGMVALTLDPAKFTRRFTRVAEPGTMIDQIAVGDGHLVLATHSAATAGQAGVPSLQAYNESDNSRIWRVDGEPGNLYFNLSAATRQVQASINTRQGQSIYSFDANSGAQRFVLNQSSRLLLSSNNGFAPTVYGSMFCYGDGFVGDLRCRDLNSGALLWQADVRGVADPVFDDWAPAISESAVFTNLNGKFSAFNRVDGRLQFQLAVPGPSSGSVQTRHELNQASVAVDANSVLVLDQRNLDLAPRDNTLSMIDLAGRRIRWQQTGQFVAHPVAGQGVVYVGNAKTGAVEARDVASGNLRWSWNLPTPQDSGFGNALILTNNLLFVSGRRNTWAIDLTTHQSVWSYPLGGQLALSAQGVLYIMNSTLAVSDSAAGVVVALNLR